jgi:hypothetical protein
VGTRPLIGAGWIVLKLLISTSAFADSELSDLVGSARHAIVVVLTYDSAGRLLGQGTGFFVLLGEVVTNRHIVADGTRIQVKTDSGRQIAVTYVLAPNKELDLAKLILADISSSAPDFPVQLTAPKFGRNCSSSVIRWHSQRACPRESLPRSAQTSPLASSTKSQRPSPPDRLVARLPTCKDRSLAWRLSSSRKVRTSTLRSQPRGPRPSRTNKECQFLNGGKLVRCPAQSDDYPQSLFGREEIPHWHLPRRFEFVILKDAGCCLGLQWEGAR